MVHEPQSVAPAAASTHLLAQPAQIGDARDEPSEPSRKPVVERTRLGHRALSRGGDQADP
jgi:hypothetical protein